MIGRPQLLVAIASATLVSSLAVVDLEGEAPGPIATAHARIADLDGGQSCAACHGGWSGLGRSQAAMTSACLECHEPIAEQLERGHGLHGTLPDVGAATPASACGKCHAEHHGASFDLVNVRSFTLAGVPDPEAFDHSRIGWPTEGKHDELGCAECHPHAEANPLPEGELRFLGLDRSCASCHEDPHAQPDGRTFALACTDCHVQRSFDEHVAVGHEAHLPLVGGHEGLSCRSCHAEEEPHSLEVLAGGGARPSARGCADCHESPHDARLLEAAAHDAGTPLAASCRSCHADDHTSFEGGLATVTPELHAAIGFVLDEPHAGVECADCHDPGLASFGARHPGRAPLDCGACHDDPHGSQFERGPFASRATEEGPVPATGGACVTCHGEEAFAPHGFDLELHVRTAFPLEGVHAETDCNDCHFATDDNEPRTFRGTPSRCDACHDDGHAGTFARGPAAAELEEAPSGTCSTCHGPTAFDAGAFPERSGIDDVHGHFTGFALTGAHDHADCASCHAPEGERALGRVEALFPHWNESPGACAACHSNPHGSVFEAASGCAECHSANSFRDFPDGFDHGSKTGFRLVGAHAEISCLDCHGPLDEPDETGRTFERALGKSCADCHADPHAGQFQNGAGVTNCGRCHTPAGAFTAARFDHDRHSRFPLTGAHENVDCQSCHESERIGGENETELVRYRPLGRACVDCHGDQAGALRRRVRGRGR